MNFAGGFTIPQENDFQFRSSWIPATPYNPIPARSHPIPVNTQGNQLGRTNWQEQVGYPGGYVQEMQNYNGVVQNLHPKMLLALNGGLANPDVTLPQRNRVINNHIASTYVQTLDYESAGWNTNTLADILAVKNAASAAAENSTLKRSIHGGNRHLGLNLQAQANQNQYQSSTIGMSLANHSCCQSPSLFNNGKSFVNTPQDGFPVPYRPNYNLNSPPRTVNDATTSFTNSFFLAPVTPDQTKKSENDRLPELLNLSIDESSTVERNKQDNLVTSIGSEAIERHNDELLQNIVDSSAAANVTSIREMSKDGDQGIDLNKTPPQKPPKRRKHRPKVVVEGKPKRTPKPATPQNPSSKQNPTGKRKYVCKNGLNASTTKPEDVMGKTIDDPVGTAAKSCRRVLNFDLEKTIDESQGNLASQLQHGTERYFNLNLDSHAIEQCNKIDNISGRKSAAQMNQHRVVEREKQEATTCNLTHSRDQLPPNYVAVPNQYVFQAPATTLIDLTTGNLNVIVSNANTQNADPKHTSKRSGYSPTNQQNMHAEGIGQKNFEDKNINASLKRTGQLMLQSSPQSVLPNVAASIEERIFKRKYHPAMEQTHQHNVTLNSLLCQEIFQVEYNKHDSNLNEGFPETQKKRKSGSGLTTNLSTFMSSFTAVADDSRRHMKNGANGVNPNPSTSQINRGVLNSHFESSSTPTKMSNGVNTYIGDWYHASSQHDFPKQYNSRELLSHTPSAVKMQSNRSTQVNNITSLGMIEKFNSTQVNNITSLGMIEKFNYLRYPASDDMKGVGTRSANSSAKEETTGPTLSNLPSDKKPLREHKNVNHNPPSPFTKKGPSKRQKYLISIDEIICQLEGLKLDDKSKESVGQEQNALVPYKADGTIISYKGLHQIKKRRPRPKVNLDPETDRLWRLLMGKEQSEATEGTNKDKEKWWEEERKVFRGRADSFIARMHLVQGDRRFSRWKGSVVDSVIGVFLTQNVSDHLSSSAFMSLAARFPMRSSSNNKTCYKSETSILVEEPEVCILDPDDTLRWSEKVSSQPVYNQRTIISQQSWDHRRENLTLGIERTTLVETNNKRQEKVISTPDFIHPSIQHSYGGTRSFSLSNLEAKEPTILFRPSKTYGSVSENLLQLEKVAMFQELHGYGNGSHLPHENFEHRHKQLKDIEFSMHNPMVNIVDSLGGSFTSTIPSHSYNSPVRAPVVTSSNYRLHNTPHSGVVEFGVLEREGISSWPSYDSGITKEKDLYCSINVGPDTESIFNPTLKQDELLRRQEMLRLRPSALLSNHRVQQQSSSNPGNFKETNQHSWNNAQQERTKVFQSKSTSITGFMTNVEALSDREKSTLHEDLNFPNLADKAFEAQTAITNNKIEWADKVTEENAKDQNYSSGGAINEKRTTALKTRKGKVEIEKNSAFDWDGLRKQVQSHSKRERMNDSMDSLDYEAVRCADVNKIAESIRERGMNNMLADRMKDFLNRIVREHGSIDLEWLRDAPPDKAKDYLLSIRGLGLKSVECVRLLTLHHLAFPVDTNVGRIAVRLGWVPLQPLPESLQLHLLEMYPVLESIQKYLWPRLCKLDQRTLYELHYQMITFGKVFCTKSKPNCNACPMRGECRHFASAFASARLALPGPEEKSIVHSSVPIEAERNPAVISNPMPLLPPGEAMYSRGHCEPIIEVPATPEPECTEISESDIEDAFYEDPDEIPTIKLNIEEFTQNLQNYMQENFEVQGGDMSKALVALSSAAASIPTAKLKNVSRLRTEHQVYELPDSHPLLKGLERREPDDPSPYLLAIWTPGETANSTQPPENQCREQDASKLCNEMTCFSCNSIREANSQTVRGTLLIPCRTAMRGSFPLNGTYFQVNEMFADHDSSLEPIDVPRAWIWNLPRRTVYFGTSVSTIFKGMSTEGIQYCFWRGFVCVRGFDQKMRAPRPLIARLHFPASEVSRTKKEKNDVNAKMQKRLPA